MKLFFVYFGTMMLAAVSAYAGGLADVIVEAAPVVMAPEKNASSVPNWVVPVAIVALLAGVAVLSGDNDDDGGAS